MLSLTEQDEWTQAPWGAGNAFALSLVPEQGWCSPMTLPSQGLLWFLLPKSDRTKWLCVGLKFFAS